MKIKLFTVAASIALLATSVVANAQKVYKEGLITYTVSAAGASADAKTYFRADSNITVSQKGPAKISILSMGAGDYLAVLVDVPVASMKKAAVATPAEIEDGKAMFPEFTFTQGTETKTIGGFNCKKVNVKDSKSGQTFEAWVTNDVKVPVNGISMLYSKLGGFPVQFKTYQQGQVVDVTVKSISDEKVPAKMFAIPADFDKISMADLQALGGGKR